MFATFHPHTTSTLATAPHPRDALFSAHSTSAVALTIYLIVGSALAAAAMAGMGYAQQLEGGLAWLPYAALLAMLLWFAAGAWVMKRQQRKVKACAQRYNAYVHRHAHVPSAPANGASLPTDEPWELRAFWSQSLAASASAALVPTPAAPRATTPARASAHLQTAAVPAVRLSAALVKCRPARPVSLFGAYQ